MNTNLIGVIAAIVLTAMGAWIYSSYNADTMSRSTSSYEATKIRNELGMIMDNIETYKAMNNGDLPVSIDEVGEKNSEEDLIAALQSTVGTASLKVDFPQDWIIARNSETNDLMLSVSNVAERTCKALNVKLKITSSMEDPIPACSITDTEYCCDSTL
ncbi:hypothetical protein V6259_12570 [Marinomonas sp. TI.3.20]|uniref:hypothetical protein n=1 Tax=Marinomonas sp. TI.3.20 TaxID=3121296 RepID=UPI0031203B38